VARRHMRTTSRRRYCLTTSAHRAPRAARRREAQALLSEMTFDRYPTVTSEASYTRERLNRAQTISGADREVELYEAGFVAGWELDFFGRVRRSIEASSADVGAAEADR
jgi:multidrug efflux system outer membrane protein